jgi:hypothetical protein
MTFLAAPTVGVWTPLGDASGGAGYLSVYLSEPIARYPIRYITKKADNKSDPNIETGTYGLFSTCERPMRRKIVREARPYLFFVTSHGGRSRALTGYYELAWFAESTGGASIGDFALAATEMRFIEPVPLDELPAEVRHVCVPPFRTIRPVDGSTAGALHDIIRSRPDTTERYLSELRRVEQFARYHSGYAYPSWGQVDGFSWQDADRYFGATATTEPMATVPSTGRWRCVSCQRVITSWASLKSCPACREMGTLRPETE